jgi:hypothetical protein
VLTIIVLCCCLGPEGVEAPVEVLNEKAVAVIRRVQVCGHIIRVYSVNGRMIMYICIYIYVQILHRYM